MESKYDCPECDGIGKIKCGEPCVPYQGQCKDCTDSTTKILCNACKGTGINPNKIDFMEEE